MKVATWNVNSLRVRLPHLVDWLGVKAPDVMCLQETKCDDAAFPADELRAAGYTSVHLGQRGYNGVAILSRAEGTAVSRGIPGFADEQSRVIAMDVDGARIVSVYVPNGQSVGSDKYEYKLRWLEALAGWLGQELVAHPRLAVLGDFNIAPEDRDVYDPAAWAGQVLASEPERCGAPPPLRVGFHRLLPPLRAARSVLYVVGLPDECLPPQDGIAHRPRAALARAREGLLLVHHRHRAAKARAAVGPCAGRLRDRGLAMSVQPAASAQEEEGRIARLRAYGVLDPDQPLPALDELVRRAQDVASFPMAWLSFFDGRRERLRARAGVSFAYLPREQSFAFGAEAPREPLFIEDLAATVHATHPLVASGPQARFIGILPLAAPDGFVVGTLTVLDGVARSLGRAERTALGNIASLAMARLEAGRDDAAGPVPSAARPRRSPRGRDAQAPRGRGGSRAGAGILRSGPGQPRRRLLPRLLGWRDPAMERGAFQRDRLHAAPRSARCIRWTSSPSATGPPIEAAMREVFDQGREMSLEAEIVDRAGNVRPYAVSGKPLRVGERTYMVGVARDITLRKRTEQQMVRAKERLDLALTGSRLALWDWDLRNNKVYFNESWSSLLGGDPRESTFTGDEVAQWNHPDDRASSRPRSPMP